MTTTIFTNYELADYQLHKMFLLYAWNILFIWEETSPYAMCDKDYYASHFWFNLKCMLWLGRHSLVQLNPNLHRSLQKYILILTK